MAYFVLITVIVIISIGASDRGCGIKCFSFGCRHNKGGKCGRQGIAIYDNTVKGLCLYHTEDMKERILKPMKKGRLLEEVCITADKLAIMPSDIQDEEVLKNPVAFAEWMKRHGMER